MNYQELQEAKQTFRIHTLEKEFRNLDTIRSNFVRTFTSAKISSMDIDEYIEGKQSKKSFCYIIERSLKGLGNISGVNSSIFGVWFSPTERIYKFDDRLGEDYEKAFETVRGSILDLLKAGKKHDYDSIIGNPLNSLVKGKILSVYYPDEYLNIFSEGHLNHYLKAFDLDTRELMKQNVLYKRDALLEFKNKDKDMKKWSINMFAVFLWSHYPKAPLDPKETDVKPKEEEIKFPTPKTITFIDNLELTSGKQKGTKRKRSDIPTPDYEKEARKYKKLGDRGEALVMQAEIKRLMNELSISEVKARKLVKWVSRESDAYGYDIQSVNNDKTPRYIEVKATHSNIGNMDFYYTQNEYETAQEYGENYFIYVVYEILTDRPKIWAIKNPFIKGNGIVMKPVKYKVEVRAEHSKR